MVELIEYKITVEKDGKELYSWCHEEVLKPILTAIYKAVTNKNSQWYNCPVKVYNKIGDDITESRYIVELIDEIMEGEE